MTPQEAAKVLAKAAAYDNRQPNEAAALAWSEALNQDMPLANAENSHPRPRPTSGRPCSTQQCPVKPSKRRSHGPTHPGRYPHPPGGLKGPQNAVQRIDRAGNKRARGHQPPPHAA